MSPDIPTDIRISQTIPDMIEAVDKIRDFDTVRIIRYLARIDRLSPGWITIFSKFIIGLFFTAIFLIVYIIALTYSLTAFIHQAAQFLKISRPGIWVDPNWVTTQRYTDNTYLLVMLLVIIFAEVLLFSSNKFIERLRGIEFWSGRDTPPVYIRFPLRYVEVIVWLAMTTFVGTLAIITLYPIAFLLFQFIRVGFLLVILSGVFRTSFITFLVLGIHRVRCSRNICINNKKNIPPRACQNNLHITRRFRFSQPVIYWLEIRNARLANDPVLWRFFSIS